MEINAIEIGVILTILAAAPVLYILFNSSHSNTKVKRKFTSLCAANGVHLTNYDIIGSAVLGLDSTLKKVVYSTLADIESKFQVVDLSAVKHCEVKTAQSKKKYLELVELELAGESLRNDIVVYAENDETLMADPNICLHELRKWEKLIKQHML